jgi:hypothetical protein
VIIVKKPIAIDRLKKLAQSRFGNLVKAAKDVDKKVMAIDGELHSDEEALLLEKGSNQENVWGINLYPELKGDNFIEFDSMINVRPSTQNMRGVLIIPKSEISS